MNFYEEKQIFKWRWMIFLPVAIFALLPTLLVGEVQESKLALIIVGIVLLLTGFLLLAMKQTIQIDADGIHYKQSPFHWKFHHFSWADIQDWKVTKINPLSEFGGWGIRITLKKKGYIMEGEYGLELKTAAKKLTVFSMKDKIATEKVMNQYFK